MSAPEPQRDELPAARPAAWYEANPHAKISFSRLATFRRCPGWYRYQYLGWHRTPTPAVTRAGHAVQEIFERLVELEPAADATLDDLVARAATRAESYLARRWEEEQAAHAADPNAQDAFDLPLERYAGYLRNALGFHGLEVEARLAGRHPRSGQPLDLPALDSVRDAWVAVRPWHVPLGADSLAGMESIPAGYFQGQYDLVYTWTGGRRIVDLKASSGASPFSTEITTQLLAYAWLERELGRGRPEGLEAWFLGQDEPRCFEIPPDAELDAFAREVRTLIDRSGTERGFGEWDPADFPVEPAPCEGHVSREGNPSVWCDVCPAAWTCSRSAREAPPAGAGVALDHLHELTPDRPAVVEGIVLGIGEPLEKKGRWKRRFTLGNRTGLLSSTWDAPVVDRLIGEGLRYGRHVRLSGLNPWRHGSGDVLLFPTPSTRLELL